jgi:hypothetical protein
MMIPEKPRAIISRFQYPEGDVVFVVCEPRLDDDPYPGLNPEWHADYDRVIAECETPEEAGLVLDGLSGGRS